MRRTFTRYPISASTSDNVYYWNGVDRVPKDVVNVVIEDGVDRVRDFAFSNCTNLSSVMIPNSVVFIGSFSFFKCNNLSKLSIGDSVEVIDTSAFSGCESLLALKLPGSLLKINDNAFYGCRSLTRVVIPENVSVLRFMAFDKCTMLKSVYLPGSIKNIETLTFCDCDSLSEVTLSEGIEVIKGNAFEGCTSLKSITIPSSVTSIEFRAFKNCKNLTEVILLNDSVNIGEEVFDGTPLETPHAESVRPEYSWDEIKSNLNADLDRGHDPLYEETESGIALLEICDKVDTSLGVQLEPSTQGGWGIVSVYSLEDSTLVASDIEFTSFNDTVLDLAIESKSEKAFMQKYKKFLGNQIEDHRVD